MFETYPIGRSVAWLNLNCTQDLRLEIASIGSDACAFEWDDSFPMGDATASRVPNETQGFPAPCIAFRGAWFADDPHLGLLEVGPKRPAPPADRAIGNQEVAPARQDELLWRRI